MLPERQVYELDKPVNTFVKLPNSHSYLLYEPANTKFDVVSVSSKQVPESILVL